MPAFTPDAGLYSQQLHIAISCATVGAVIHYTTSGTFPTEADLVVASGSSVHIANTSMLRAKAFMDDGNSSPVKSGFYEITTDPNNHTPPVITLIRPGGAVIVP